jgi:hypothetical protein
MLSVNAGTVWAVAASLMKCPAAGQQIGQLGGGPGRFDLQTIAGPFPLKVFMEQLRFSWTADVDRQSPGAFQAASAPSVAPQD